MRFSKLRLTGFKSFVDPTDLMISDGLTGVVGPNGCGKSNLLEALRWVMGENRPTAMRGSGMEDVVFAGTATRPARNFAEVSLHIDNRERLAPTGFNDLDQLEIVRRITRDIGSAYKANGKEVRARDVQMLFADASTGAHSPALVRQGQISELINARPKARRRILEEAAGISGLYQRRHEAELKLKGTETNLTRVDDVIEQLAQQLAQLARQARQAARYRDIGSALRLAEGRLLYRRWVDADMQRAVALAALDAAGTEAASAGKAAREAATLHEAAQTALPPLREEEAIAGAVLQRAQVEQSRLAEQEAAAKDAVSALTGRVAQLARDLERESGLNTDAFDTISRLERENASLTRAAEGHDARLAAREEAARAAAETLRGQEAALGELTEDLARLSARHQSAQRLAEDARKTLDQAGRDAVAAQTATGQAKAALSATQGDQQQAADAEAEARALAERAEAALGAAETARARTQTQETEARAARSQADGVLSALSAEVTALQRLLRRDPGAGEQLLDLVRVDAGFEKALGAALGDDLRAPLSGPDDSGWRALPGYSAPQPLPEGATAMASHVTAPQALSRRLAQIGVVRADQGAALHSALRPGQRLVTREGAVWRWDGLWAGAGDGISASALRLEQQNRLSALEAEQAGARADAEEAGAAHKALGARLAELSAADTEARSARRDADQGVARAGRALSRAEAEATLAQGRLESATLAVQRHKQVMQQAQTARDEAEAQRATLPDLTEARDRREALITTVEAARTMMMERRSAHEELRREGEARARRTQQTVREMHRWRERLATAETRIAELAGRKSATEAELETTRCLPGEIAETRAALSGEVTRAETRRASASDALSTAEGELRAAAQTEREAERAASRAREARAAADARADAARSGVSQASDRIAEARETDVAGLLNDIGTAEDLPAADTLETDIARLKRQRDALGAVNLRAEEDAREVHEEHDTLVREKADLLEAIRTLRAGIASLNREGRERLLTAFEQVNANFAMLFTHLFGGGEANLVMVESDDPLDAGLEIMCQPPGKRLSTLSLLSGGEQTLTAMALIFAVFLANPAPICVLDEVDAPLDDANVTRFCDLLDEMCRQTDTRFLIITHHAVTMARMDRLFGVTMGEQGVSQLVSVDLKKAETLVA